MFNIAAPSSSTSEARTANQKQRFENEILKWRKSASLKPLQQRNYWLQNVFHSYENQRVTMSLKPNQKKSDMSVEAITDAKHEYMYEKLNDSPEAEKKKKNRHVEKRKRKYTKQTNRP